jgi:hypothetical protein
LVAGACVSLKKRGKKITATHYKSAISQLKTNCTEFAILFASFDILKKQKRSVVRAKRKPFTKRRREISYAPSMT